MTVADLHRDYVVMRQTKNYPPETYEFYLRVFVEKINIKFLKPRKDKCDTCERYSNLGELSEELVKKKEKHLRDKEEVRNLNTLMKEKAKQEENLSVCI